MTITCTNITVSRLYGSWQSHVQYSQSVVRIVTITCTLQSVGCTDRDNHMYITVSRLYGPWQSHVLILQSVDCTDRDNHMYITVSRLYEPWQSHVHYSQSIVRIVTITCTNTTVSDKFAQYLSYAENCLKTHNRHPAQCSAAEDRRSWWPWRWWWSLVQDCCAGPPLHIPLLAVMRGTILTPF